MAKADMTIKIDVCELRELVERMERAAIRSEESVESVRVAIDAASRPVCFVTGIDAPDDDG